MAHMRNERCGHHSMGHKFDRNEGRFVDGMFKHNKKFQHHKHAKKQRCYKERRSQNSEAQFIMNFVR